jgi:hypothetical protein
MKYLVPMVLLVALLTGSGCIKMDMDIAIEDDGSGICKLTYAMSTEVAAAIKELSDIDTGMEDQEMPSLDDITEERASAAAKNHNVKIKKFERDEADGQENFEMVLAFKKLDDVSRMISELMDEDDGQIYTIFRTADGNYRLTSADDPEASTATEEPAEEEEPSAPDPSQMDSEQMQKSMEVMGKLMAHMSELDIRMAFTVPGDILATTAMTQEGRTAIWQVNISNMMSMQEQDMEPDITFSSQGVKIDAPEWQE